MIYFIDIQKIKDKFGCILSMAYTDCNIDLDNINERLITHPRLDFLERNDLNDFLTFSTDAIVKKIFDKNIIEHRDKSAELYWAGIQYLNISLNCSIPLKQVLLLFPLGEMVESFPAFHEMSGEKLVEKYLTEHAKRSILKELRKRKEYSVRQLSILTGIAEQTLKYYEKDNNNLFNASFQNIEKISEVLEYSKDIYKNKSSFVPYTRSIFAIERYKKYAESFIGELYKKEGVTLSLDEPIMGYTYVSNGKEKKDYLSDADAYMMTLQGYRNILIYKEGKGDKLVL